MKFIFAIIECSLRKFPFWVSFQYDKYFILTHTGPTVKLIGIASWGPVPCGPTNVSIETITHNVPCTTKLQGVFSELI